IRAAVYNEVGITVSVGVSTTRILAKTASEMNKPNGTTIITGRRINNFLKGVPVGDIPGIGRNRKQLMFKFHINTAYDFISTPIERIDYMLGKVGVDLWHELSGNPVFPLELHPSMPKTIARTASLGLVSHNKALIERHLTYHTTRVVTELVRQQLTTSLVSVFIRLKSFEAARHKVRITPTNDYSNIIRVVLSIFKHLFKHGEQYRACGVVASAIAPDVQQGNLFQKSTQTGKQLALTKVMDDINTRFGSQVLAPANALRKTTREQNFKYPLIIAN
ncbi:MAG: DNA polymerase IV, partial [Ghiorsea sp.]|nr:DNA polymerase IV [Ghiorsea sp.]